MRRTAMWTAVAAAVLAGVALTATRADSHGQDGFRPLFNGKDLTGWTTEGNWLVRDDGVLTIKPRAGEEGWKRFEDYLWTKRKYGDFVLKLEYKHKEGGNSGVFFRVGDRSNPVKEGIEVQILDSHGKPDGKMSHHDCGGVIGTVAPKTNAAKPADQWNRMKIRSEGQNLTVWLNGEQIIDRSLKGTSRESRPLRGYIGLQDHGLRLWFRDVKIKTLD